eukprot:434224_1
MQLKVLKKCKCGDGKSGAFFYITHDNKYIVKTIKKYEVKKLIKILRYYKNYLDNNTQTILSRFIGLHSIKIYGLHKYFVVMENVFRAKLKPTEIYDLKGSWIGRITEHGLFDGSIMKDLDLKRHIILNNNNRNNVLKQLDKDTKFLYKYNIMDYSLLLGIHYMKIANCNDDNNIGVVAGDVENKYDDMETTLSMPLDCISASINDINSNSNSNTKLNTNTSYYLGGLRAHIIEGPGIYYVGIIDYLQSYTWKKRLETWFRIKCQRLDKNGISCVEPKKYRLRFMKYMKNIMISENKYKTKLKLKNKTFTKEYVLIYPLSKNINKNL